MKNLNTFTLFLILLFAFYYLNSDFELSNENSAPNNDSTVTISIIAVGDLMCHSIQFNYSYVSGDSFDFRPVFRFVKPILSNGNFTFGNLETVAAGKVKKYSGYPLFNCPDDFITALKDAGFKLLNTANNHAMDKRIPGLERNIKQLIKNDLSYEGTFLSERDRDSLRIFNIEGIKLAFLSYTYGTNDIPIPKKKSYAVNLIDTLRIKTDIERARIDSADIVLVHFHFGEQYRREPTQFQKDIVNKTINYGADLIIGDHPHVVEPLEFFKTKNTKLDSGLVAYSLGNFLSNQRWRYSDGGMIIKILITKDFSTDSLFLNKVDIIPTWVFRGKTSRGNEFIIIPSDTSAADSTKLFLTQQDSTSMNQSFVDTKEILMRHIKSSNKITFLKSPVQPQ